MKPQFRIRSSILVISFFASQFSHAAACCGGAFSVPALILGDDKAQFTASASASQVDTDVGSDGVWRKRSSAQQVQTVKLEGAHLLSDRWQAGGSLPVVFNQRDSQVGSKSGSGVGDLAVNVAYEAIPEIDYSEWRPRGVTFVQLVVPTGKSPYESSNLESLDVTGRGLYSLGGGIALTKIISSWDTMLIFQGHRSLNRSVDYPSFGGRVQLHPGFGGSVLASGGYNLRSFRFGAALSINYEDPIAITGAHEASGAAERYWTGSLSAAYLMEEDWAVALTYADTRLFGTPVNTTLGPTITLALQKRFPR